MDSYGERASAVMVQSAHDIDSTTTEPRLPGEDPCDTGLLDDESLSVLIADLTRLVSSQAEKIARQGALLGQLHVQQEAQIKRLDALLSSAAALHLTYEADRAKETRQRCSPP